MSTVNDYFASLSNDEDPSNLLYQIEGIFLAPMHELVHCYMAHWLGEPILIKKDSVFYSTSSWINDLLITIAPTIFSTLFIVWAAVSFIFSDYSYSSWIVLILQVSYSVWHLSLCRQDLFDVYVLVRYGD